MKGFAIAAIITLLLGLKAPETASPLDRLSWLTGAWYIPGEKSVYYEFWERKNDSLFSGEGMVLDGPDTVFYESIKLQLIENDIYYIVSSREQNAGNQVAFRLIHDSAGTFIFENPEHDFPQRIVYRHPTEDSLAAYIEGSANGKYQRSDFPMIRRK